MADENVDENGIPTSSGVDTEPKKQKKPMSTKMKYGLGIGILVCVFLLIWVAEVIHVGLTNPNINSISCSYNGTTYSFGLTWNGKTGSFTNVNVTSPNFVIAVGCLEYYYQYYQNGTPPRGTYPTTAPVLNKTQILQLYEDYQNGVGTDGAT